eukprot:1162082-Pelagomonas_calceolata.AAC.3
MGCQDTVMAASLSQPDKTEGSLPTSIKEKETYWLRRAVPGWSCVASSAPYLFVTSHIAEYPMRGGTKWSIRVSRARSDQDSVRAAEVVPALIRNARNNKVTLHIILIGLASTIHNEDTIKPLVNLGLSKHKAKSLAFKLSWGFNNLPDPHYFSPFPSPRLAVASVALRDLW